MYSDYASSSTLVTQYSTRQLWQAARKSGYPVALWRLPNRTEKHLIVHFGDTALTVEADLEELPAGFAVSPFTNPDLAKTLFLRADAHFVIGERGQIESERVVPGEAANRFRQLLDAQPPTPDAPVSARPGPTEQPDPDARQRYLTAVAEAVTRMKQGEFRKVVLSRTKTVVFDQTPDVVQLVEQLGAAYPHAFISAVWLPAINQVWISATPERLVSVDANGIFRTVALAGTQSALAADGHRKVVTEATWTHKEIEEQALVCRYIIDCFKRVRLREYVEEGPKTVIAGNLMHLRTDFSVDTRAVHFPQMGTVMLHLLHPTSAVCGMPRETALRFINHHETHDRALYSGFLGPVNIEAESNLFVQLRCLKLEGKVATLYAGAGLTEDSVPEREWQETELKCGTLLNVATGWPEPIGVNIYAKRTVNC